MSDQINITTLAKPFSDEDAASEMLERLRWPTAPIFSRRKSNVAYWLTPEVESTRPVCKSVLKCKACRKQFTVTVGAIFEDSHIPLSGLLAIHLLYSSKKGMSAHQLMHILGLIHCALAQESFR